VRPPAITIGFATTRSPPASSPAPPSPGTPRPMTGPIARIWSALLLSPHAGVGHAATPGGVGGPSATSAPSSSTLALDVFPSREQPSHPVRARHSGRGPGHPAPANESGTKKVTSGEGSDGLSTLEVVAVDPAAA